MDERGGIYSRNCEFIEPTMMGTQNGSCLQLVSSLEKKPFSLGTDHHFHNPHQPLPHQLHPAIMTASTTGGQYHHHWIRRIFDSPIPISYMRDSYMSNPQETLSDALPSYQHLQSQLYFGVMPENSSAPRVPEIQQSNFLIQQSNLLKNNTSSIEEEQRCEETDAVGDIKKRGSGKTLKSTEAKKTKKDIKAQKEQCSRSVYRARAPKKSAEVIINGIKMDISGLAIPVCTCTGTPQQCYRWGTGGWQSACCTTGISMYPLPISAKRRGARIAGRKMSFGAFRKVLEKLSSDGYDFSNPIDLRPHWAKHGTNKFVTIR